MTTPKNAENLGLTKTLSGPISSEVSLFSEGSSFEGTLQVPAITRFHGRLTGAVIGKTGSTLILGESGSIEGRIDGDSVWINGFVRGPISAKTRLVLSSSARVIGDIESPTIEIQAGAHFEGSCRVGQTPVSQASDSEAKASP